MFIFLAKIALVVFIATLLVKYFGRKSSLIKLDIVQLDHTVKADLKQKVAKATKVVSFINEAIEEKLATETKKVN